MEHAVPASSRWAAKPSFMHSGPPPPSTPAPDIHAVPTVNTTPQLGLPRKLVWETLANWFRAWSSVSGGDAPYSIRPVSLAPGGLYPDRPSDGAVALLALVSRFNVSRYRARRLYFPSDPV
jgi:hypothetical protein